MSLDKNHNELFKRYLKGQMTSEEAHAFEREVLDDPFAQEALEGFESAGIHSLDDLESLKNRISKKEEKPFPFLKIAAVVALLIIGSFTVYKFTSQIEGEQLAMEEKPLDELVQSSPSPDTLLSSSTSKEEQIAEEMESSNRDEIPKTEIVEAESEEELQLVAEDLSIEVDEEIEEESETLVLAEVVEVDESSLASQLQGKVAGLEVTLAPIKLDEPSTDIIIHEQLITVADSFFDEEEAKEAKADGDNSSDTFYKSKKGATARSARAIDNEVLTGRITDEFGEALPGVTVLIKGTTTGTTTGLDGFFELTEARDKTLVIAYVGFETQEIEVGSRSDIETTLLANTANLQEVVVTAKGIERSEVALGYSVPQVSVGNKEFKKYLEENLQYPEAARTNRIEGTVVLQLTINELGTVTEIVVKKSLGYGCDEEAKRLVREGPSWEPAEKDGNHVEDKLKVRVKFRLDR